MFAHKIFSTVLAGAGVLTLGLSACASPQTSGSSESNTDMTFAIGAPVLVDSTAPYASVPTTLDYWADEGINVKTQPTKGATDSMQLLLAGKANVTNGGTSSIYQAAAENPELRVISLQSKNIWQMSVPEDSPIEEISELKGETIGVQSLSSASYLFGRAAIAASGLDPDSDVEWLATGVGNQAAAAFENHDIVAYATYDGPNSVVGQALGKKVINLPTPLDDVPGLSGYATTEQYLEDHPDEIVSFLTGATKGAIFSATNPAAALQIQWEENPEQQPDAPSIKEALEKTVPTVEARYKSAAEPGPDGIIGEIPTEDAQTAIDFMVKYGVLEEKLDASKVVDLSLTKEVEIDVGEVEQQAKDWTP